MSAGRIVTLAVGCLLVIPALAVMVAGAILGLGYAFGRDDDGYVEVTIDPLSTTATAIVADDLAFGSAPGSPDWAFEMLDADVRLRVDAGSDDLFIGVAPTSAVSTYLDGVAHDTIVDMDDLVAIMRTEPGRFTVTPPADVDIWAAQASGSGTQEIEWEAEAGTWTVVLMNADGTAGLDAEVLVGAKAGFVLPLAVMMVGLGAVLALGSAALIVAGAAGASPSPRSTSSATAPASGNTPINVGQYIGRQSAPVRFEAELDPVLSRWLWLVKWILVIPHVIVLAMLWVAFAVITVVAGLSILVSGRYPPRLFEFNVGVLRWTWRVSHYAGVGGLGTDQYPAFSLQPVTSDRTTLEVEYPERLSRASVLFKWILAIPHLLVVAILTGPSIGLGGATGVDLPVGGGLLGLLALICGVLLLSTNRYPRELFDLIVGLNRWVYRVIVYVALMTDEYPPFRLDQGANDPTAPLQPPPSEDRDRDMALSSSAA